MPNKPDLRHITATELHPLAVPLDSIARDPDNERAHPRPNIDRIKYALRRFGMRGALSLRADGQLVTKGNGTHIALSELAEERATGKWKGAPKGPLAWGHAPVLEFDDSPEDAAEYRVLDNRAGDNAGWDRGAVEASFEAFPDVDWDQSWTQAELAAEFEGWGDGDGGGGSGGDGDGGDKPNDEPPIPDPPAEPITRPGDVWFLGDHRLVCGDTFDDDARALLLEGTLADMILMDPPFAIYGSSTGIGADIADDKMIQPFFRSLGFVAVQSVREQAHVYICCDWRSWASIWAGMTGANLSPKNCLIWDKGGGLGAMYQHSYEMIGFFTRMRPPKTMRGAEHDAALGHQRTVNAPNILRFNRAHGDERLHNAAKPIAMLEHLITNSSDKGETVADFFNGSGSVIIAGERTGRRVRAMEKEPKWCDVTAKRWEAETGREAQLLRGGEVVAHEFEHEVPEETPTRRTPARDGDKRQARRRVQTLIANGTLPKPADVVCVDCKKKPGREYDHHLGYGAEHHEDVVALCAKCHHKRDPVNANAPA